MCIVLFFFFFFWALDNTDQCIHLGTRPAHHQLAFASGRAPVSFPVIVKLGTVWERKELHGRMVVEKVIAWEKEKKEERKEVREESRDRQKDVHWEKMHH